MMVWKMFLLFQGFHVNLSGCTYTVTAWLFWGPVKKTSLFFPTWQHFAAVRQLRDLAVVVPPGHKASRDKDGCTPNVRVPIPIGSMYDMFSYIYHINQPNVGKYTIHGCYGIWYLAAVLGWGFFGDGSQKPHEYQPGFMGLCSLGFPIQGPPWDSA